jgi:hypothetical protein
MKWVRTAVAAAVLAGLALGCSKNTSTAPSVPAGAPSPDQEKRLTPTKPGTGPGGPKTRPAGQHP